MSRAQIAIISILGATICLTGSAEAAGNANYCVVPVPIVADVQGGSRPPDGKIVSQKSQEIEPNYIKLADVAGYPIAYDSFTYERTNGERQNHQLFWGFGSKRELIGPYDVDGFTLQTAIGEFASGPDKTLFVGGRYTSDGPGLGVFGADGKK
jgi:hypothetical protein